MVVNDQAVPPLSVSLGGDAYPSDDEIGHILQYNAGGVVLIEGTRLAAEMGNSKVLNVLMLGAFSLLLPFTPEVWKQGIAPPSAAQDTGYKSGGFRERQPEDAGRDDFHFRIRYMSR